MGGLSIRRTTDFGQRHELRAIDEDIKKNCRPDVLTRAILWSGCLGPALANKLKKDRLLGARSLEPIAAAISKAIYDIPTCRGWFMNGQIEPGRQRERTLRVAATILPWADGEKGVGPMYLCMNVDYSRKASLIARLRIVTLTVGDVTRTVLVTDHVCDQVEKRAGIRGSHVAFVADSVVYNKLRIARQPNRVPLLTIYDRDQRVIGYCPIGEKRCGLQRTQDAMELKGGKKFVGVQDRWRLKTFLPTEYYNEDESGCLVLQRSAMARRTGVTVSVKSRKVDRA